MIPTFHQHEESGRYRGTTVQYGGESFTSETGDQDVDLERCREWLGYTQDEEEE